MQRLKKTFKSLLIQLVFCSILLVLGYLVALFVPTFINITSVDVMIAVGFLLLLIGFILFPRGRYTGFNLQGLGQRNASTISNQALEADRLVQETERKSPDYYHNFYRFSMKDTSLHYTFLCSGALLLLYASQQI